MHYFYLRLYLLLSGQTDKRSARKLYIQIKALFLPAQAQIDKTHGVKVSYHYKHIKGDTNLADAI